ARLQRQPLFLATWRAAPRCREDRRQAMNLRAEFERCWSFLAPAVAAYGPTHDKQHVWERIEAGEAHLFPMPNAAMVVELKRWPTGFKEAVAWLAGGSGDEIETFTPRIEAWARAEG